LLGFTAHDIDTRPGDALAERLRRARAALHRVLEQLLDAHLEHGDRAGPLRDLMSMIRRWIEAHTFAPATGEGGLRLLDATAARYGTFASVHVLGLVESDWPEPAGRTVLYPSGVLKDLNWPGAGSGQRARARS
jgi:hypothetical protein